MSIWRSIYPVPSTPTRKDELKGLIDQYVREEILSREAVKLDWIRTTR